jgi:hypothetical protein
MASINLFGVTVALISSEFADYDPFDANSSPTSTEVERWISSAASRVNGYLLGQGFTLSDVAGDPVAKSIAQRAVIELTIVFCAPKMRGAAETRAETAQERFDDWVSELKSNPGFLGDAYSSATMGQGARAPLDQERPWQDAQTRFSREFKPRNTQF